MRRDPGTGWALLAPIFWACAPPVNQLSADRYELNCQYGLGECRQMATRVCPSGYEVIEARTTPSDSGVMLVRCEKSEEEQWREASKQRPPQAEPSACPPAMPPGVECVRNFHCTQSASQCVDGKCVSLAPVVQVDPDDRCMVGAAGGEPVPLFPTRDSLGEFAAKNSGTKAATLSLVTKLGGTWVDAGVRCKTLEQLEGRRRVQLLSGPLAGREGWLAVSGWFADAGAPP